MSAEKHPVRALIEAAESAAPMLLADHEKEVRAKITAAEAWLAEYERPREPHPGELDKIMLAEHNDALKRERDEWKQCALAAEKRLDRIDKLLSEGWCEHCGTPVAALFREIEKEDA